MNNAAYDDSKAAFRVVAAGGSFGNSGNVTLSPGPNFIGLATVVPNGAVADNAASAGNPVPVGGIYNASAPTYDDGDRTTAQSDVNGNWKVREQYAPGYEDNTNNVAKVEQRFSYGALLSVATTTIKASAGFLHTFTVGMVSCPTIIWYDSTVPSGTRIFTTQAGLPVGSYHLDVSFGTGLTLDPVAAAGGSLPQILVSYR
jgi:hypothetical protein